MRKRRNLHHVSEGFLDETRRKKRKASGLKPDTNVSKAKKPSRFSAQFSKLRNIRQTIRENEKRERALVTTRIKIITFFVSLVAMMVAFSFIPLFPQPLPLLVAVLSRLSFTRCLWSACRLVAQLSV